jgi:hypothetical protein
MRSASIAAMLAIASLAATLSARDAKASVSAEALFAQLVEEATVGTVVVPVEQRALWNNPIALPDCFCRPDDGRISPVQRVRFSCVKSAPLPWKGFVHRRHRRVPSAPILASL